MGGKGVPEAMGGDGFFNTRFQNKVFNDIKYHHPTKSLASVV